MPRTRSSIARAAPKPHKLPTDILTRVAAFACDDELARLALSAKSALAALDNRQIWAATLRTNHGGLRIRADEPSGLKAAARLASARTNKGPVYGCHALASDVSSYGGGPYWVDGMFQPEPWRVYYSAMGNGRVLCAATFLTGGTYDPDRPWMIDALLNLVDPRDLQRDYSQWTGICPDTVEAVFYREFGSIDCTDRMNRKCAEIEERFRAGEAHERTGLDATAFEERDDGVTVDARVEALCGGARQATVVATALFVRRPTEYATRPGRLILLFGCRRPPRVTDVSDGRLKRLASDATAWCRILVENPPRKWVAAHAGMAALGCTAARSLEANHHKGYAAAFQLFGSDDEEIFPLALCGFQRDIDPDVTGLRAELYRPVAIQGILVAILEVDNEEPDLGVNVDMEYVRVEGYTYA